ncbi:fumarylacetoacetate hydrolase family protein [Spirochaetia bacterium 38H-sp]|uniref:Fumarylacetoacetate hydrolase family protein n=1 Tax=Rarispira pelagica TaxID=3141764 RepID=A0ABU9UDX0_9SPIR
MLKLPVIPDGGFIDINPSKIIALGLNYVEHARESISQKVSLRNDLPDEPVLFVKTPNVLVGPGEAIVLPVVDKKYVRDAGGPRTDYEAELALIIGRRAKNVPVSEAMDYVMGFTCFNDVSQRDIQTYDRSGWWRGKSLDTFGPIGPCVVPANKIGDVHNLRIRSILNGKVVQDASTSELIFKIPEIISFVSRFVTLEEGDIISTGTPAGVGPLSPGDVIEVDIENIGVLKNPVVSQ